MDLEEVARGALPPIGAALLLVSLGGARLLALAAVLGLFAAFWLLKREQPPWPHDLWFAPSGDPWLVWSVVAAALVALLEHARVLRGRVAAGFGAAVAAFAVWLVLEKVSMRWADSHLILHVGGGALVAALLVLATRTTLARAPKNVAPAVVFTLLLSALSVLLVEGAKLGLFAQLCGALAAAVGAGAATSLWKRPFALAPAEGAWLGGAYTLFVLAGVHLGDLPLAAAGCALVAPAALFLLKPGAAQRPLGWLVVALVLAGVPMAAAFWFAQPAAAAGH